MTEKPYCTCCGRFTPGGLHVYAAVICRSCETRIARLRVDDPDYTQWVQTIHSLWSCWEQRIKESKS